MDNCKEKIDLGHYNLGLKGLNIAGVPGNILNLDKIIATMFFEVHYSLSPQASSLGCSGGRALNSVGRAGGHEFKPQRKKPNTKARPDNQPRSIKNW